MFFTNFFTIALSLEALKLLFYGFENSTECKLGSRIQCKVSNIHNELFLNISLKYNQINIHKKEIVFSVLANFSIFEKYLKYENDICNKNDYHVPQAFFVRLHLYHRTSK